MKNFSEFQLSYCLQAYCRQLTARTARLTVGQARLMSIAQKHSRPPQFRELIIHGL